MPASGGNAHERAAMGGSSCPARHHLISFGHLILNGDMHIREGGAIDADKATHAHQTGHLLSGQVAVSDPVGGSHRFGGGDVSLVPDFLKEPTNERPVCFC